MAKEILLRLIESNNEDDPCKGCVFYPGEKETECLLDIVPDDISYYDYFKCALPDAKNYVWKIVKRGRKINED